MEAGTRNWSFEGAATKVMMSLLVLEMSLFVVAMTTTL
jgi:hypothetical protein